MQRLVKYAAASILSFSFFYYLLQVLSPISPEFTFKLSIQGPPGETVQIYYAKNDQFSEENSLKSGLGEQSEFQVLPFRIRQNIDKIRIDLGNKPGQWLLKEIKYQSFSRLIQAKLESSLIIERNQIKMISRSENGGLVVETNGTDPYLEINYPPNIKSMVAKDNVKKKYIQNALIALIPALLSVVVLKKRKSIIVLFQMMLDKRSLIYNLAKNDFKTKYAGSYLGVIWAFIQPVMTVLIYWFVFEIGFKAGPMQSAPFILWLVAGMVPWFFFADSLTNATNSMIEYNYLVKKVVFNVEILPIIKHLASLFVHLFFIVLTLVVFALYGYMPQIEFVQILYYSISAMILSYSLSVLCCSLIVFFKDLGQIVSLIMQFGMWITPILWSYTMLPAQYQWLLKINPMYYVVEGYRDSLLGQVWFWERYYQTVYFWSICVLFFLVGTFVFRRLRPHFADVL